MCKHDLGFSRSGANFAIPNAMAGTRSGLPPACRCWARRTRHFETLSLRHGKHYPWLTAPDQASRCRKDALQSNRGFVTAALGQEWKARYPVERPLLLREATFANASGSDDLAPKRPFNSRRFSIKVIYSRYDARSFSLSEAPGAVILVRPQAENWGLHSQERRRAKCFSPSDSRN